MAPTSLTRLQSDVLRAFFARDYQFFLTGGAALTAFYLHHRETDDLDLFTTRPALNEGIETLTACAQELGASVEVVRDTPHLKRLVLRQGGEQVKVDLVHDLVAQGPHAKREIDGMRVDAPEEILANKLCALLGRSEVRDLVDVYLLERAGYRVDDALPVAATKDGGMEAGQLAAVLMDWELGPDLAPPGGIMRADLDVYRRALITRLLRLAGPPAGPPRG